MKKTSVFSNALIWFGAAVSPAEILTGMMVAPLGLYKGIAAIVIGHIIGGVTMLQLREKELPYDEFLKEAREISALCKRYGVPFIVNDNIDIAIL